MTLLPEDPRISRLELASAPKNILFKQTEDLFFVLLPGEFISHSRLYSATVKETIKLNNHDQSYAIRLSTGYIQVCSEAAVTAKDAPVCYCY